MSSAHYYLLAHGLDLEGQVVYFLVLDDDLHALKGVMVAEFDDIGVLQSNTSIAGPSRYTLLVVGAAMDTDVAIA